MRRLIIVAVMLQTALSTFPQLTINGKIFDEDTKEPLVGATVSLPDTKVGVTTKLDGSFKIEVPSDKSELSISYIGYSAIKTYVRTDTVNTLFLKSESVGLKDVVVTSSLAIDRKTPVALSVVDALTIENKLGTQEFPEVLKSTPGIYATKQGGGYGDSRVNVRGFEAANVAVMINGVPMNDMEWGGVYWSNWGALSDVTRSMQVQRGLGASKVAAPSLGGTINVVTRSTDARKGGSVSYGIGVNGYEKISFSVSTGLTSNNWALTLLGSKTISNGYIQGTEYEAYSYFLNISKKINDSHQLSLTAFSAPQWHNQRNNADKLLISEWQKQPMKYRYNASYGFDMNGQRKKSSYNYYNKPQISFNHLWQMDHLSSLSTSVYLSIGDGGGWSGQGATTTDRTNWYGSTNGVPNTLFRSSDGTFDYGAIYKLNTDPANNGMSKMVMSTSTNNHVWVGTISTFKSHFGNYIDFYGGIDLRYYKGTHTNKITDLYGGNYFIDPTARPFLSNSDWQTKKLGVGDIVYRDYDGFITNEGAFAQAEYNRGGLSAFISASASNTSNWRSDRFYYDSSQALSKTISFLGYSGKGGANYNLDDHNNVFANIGYISRAPFFSGGAFLQSTTSNEINPNAVNEKAFSAELGYGFRSKYFTAHLNVYRTNWIDKTMVRALNGNTQASLVANMQGVNALHQGVELDFICKPTKRIEIKGMISLGDWTWQNNATGYLYDNQGQPLDVNGNVVPMLSPQQGQVNVNLKGIHVGNSAQNTAHLGVFYEILDGFKLGIDGNYFGKNYSYFNISSVGTSLVSTTFSDPWMIPEAFTFDFHANYRFKIDKFDASLIGHVFNLLDTQYIVDATDGADHTWKTASVFYGWGRTWDIGLKVKF
jgi:outer membrane cobalamin receptor